MVGGIQKGNDMRITRIEIEGPKGKAAVYRRQKCVRAEMRLANGDEINRTAKADEEGPLEAMASCLQVHLDGRLGTQGDIEDYRRVVQMFAD